MPDLSQGGAEKVIMTLANELDRTRFKPILILFEKKGAYLKQLQEDVEIHELDTKRIRFSVFKLVPLLRKIKPDIVFGGWGEVSAFLSPIIPFFKSIKFVARETNVVSRHVTRKEVRFFYRFYNNFDRIIAQSDDMVEDLIQNLKIKAEKIVKINNPVNVDFILDKMEIPEQLFDPNTKNVVAIGNLTHRKGFDLLLPVFEKLKEKPISLYILGDGRDRDTLLKQKEALGLTKVHFLGIKENPFPYLHQADLFVLSSRYEGFPNVLLEAGVCGTYALANDCPGGIHEIIQARINGEIFSIEATAGFAEKITELCQIEKDSGQIRESIVSRFSKKHIIEKFNRILDEL